MKQQNLKISNLNIANVLDRKIAILGGTGSGKTTTLKLIALKAAKEGLHCFIIDPLNVITIDGFGKIIVNKKDFENGATMGKLLNKLSHKDNVIISLNGMLKHEEVKFINDMFAEWKSHDDMIFIDELHEFVGQKSSKETYSEEMERAIRHWRNFHTGFAFDTQRPAYTSKDVLALADFIIIHRTIYPTDIKVIEEILGNILTSEEMAHMLSKIQTLKAGQFFAIDFRYMEL